MSIIYNYYINAILSKIQLISELGASVSDNVYKLVYDN